MNIHKNIHLHTHTYIQANFLFPIFFFFLRKTIPLFKCIRIRSTPLYLPVGVGEICGKRLGQQPIHRLAGLVEAEHVLEMEEFGGDLKRKLQAGNSGAWGGEDLAVAPVLLGSSLVPQRGHLLLHGEEVSHQGDVLGEQFGCLR